MRLWLPHDSPGIRARIGLLALAILLPAGGALAWLLADELQHAREHAMKHVRILSDTGAADLAHRLQRAQALLARLAARPLVQAMDRTRCDAIQDEFVRLDSEYIGLESRDTAGAVVCSSSPDSPRRLAPADQRWFATALTLPGLGAGPVASRDPSGRPTLALVHPVRDASGRPVGLLLLSLDLLGLSAQLQALAPGGAVMSVLDPERTVLLRSADPLRYIGQPTQAGAPDPARGQSEGFFESKGHDGVQRLFAFKTLPGLEWRVLAGRPSAEVFAEFRSEMVRIVAIGALATIAALLLAWQIGASIVIPVRRLRRTTERIAGGAISARAEEEGPPEIRGVARDINRMLDAMALSQSRLAGIFDSASEAIITADEGQKIVLANRAAAWIFRRPVDSLIGASIDELIPQRLRAGHREAMLRFGASDPLARSMGARDALLALRADGEEFPIEAAISHVRAGEQRLFTVVLRDISERQRAANELLASKTMLDAALASMSDAALILDAQGRFLRFNLAFAAFIRFTRMSDCPGSIAELEQLIDTRQVDGQVAPLQDLPSRCALRGDSGSGLELRLRRRDTGQAWIGSFSFAPLRDSAGAITGAVVTARDVTELRHAQLALEKSHADLQRLTAAQYRIQEEERRRIARELHDDLQQILAAVKIEATFALQALDSQAPQVSAALSRIGELATHAVTSARRIVNDLRPPMLENLGLVPALQALAADFAKQTGTACEVVADAALERGDAVPMDVATCLYRVVQEALNNVRKHAQARRVCVTLTLGPGADYQLRVADDGLGIRDGDRGKPESLGLLGMQERVHALGGSLGVSGASGFGTGIDVQIPGATAPAAPDPRAAPAVQVQARVQRARAARDGGAAQASQDQRRPS